MSVLRLRSSSGIIAITILAAFLRVIKLDSSLWYDEIFSLLHFFRSDPRTVMTSLPDPNNHVLYSLLAQASIALFGESEWSVRLPAVLLGIPAIPTLYWLASRYSTKRVATLASLLLCVSMWHIWFSQDARGYSGMILFCLASQGLFLMLLESPAPRLALAYVLSMTAACYFHLFSVYTLGTHLIFLALRSRLRVSGEYRSVIIVVLGAGLVVCLLYLPMADDMVRYVQTDGRITLNRDLSLCFFLLLPVEWGGNRLYPWVSLPLFFCFLWGIERTARERPVLVWVSVLPVILALSFTALMRVFIYHRMLSFFIPWYLWFAARGLERLCEKVRLRQRQAFAGGALLLVGLSIIPLARYYKYGKQPFKDVAEWIEIVPRSVPVYSFGLSDEEFQYYCPRAKRIPWRDSLAEAVQQGGLFVSSYPEFWGPENSRLLKENCVLLRRWPASGYKEHTVYVFSCE